MSRLLLSIVFVFSYCGAARSDVVLLGDSIVADVSEPLFGWGETLPDYLPTVEIKNFASSGASTRSYFRDYWTTQGWPFDGPVNDLVNSGDYVLIQFGHNDIPSGPPAAAVQSLEEYQSGLRTIVSATKAVGGLPILVTPPEGWAHRSSGLVGPIIQRQGHADAMQSVALETNTPLIDLHGYSVEQFAIRTEAQAITDFEAIDPDSGFPSGDKTHTSLSGANIWAQFIADEFPNAAVGYFEDRPADFNLDGEVSLADFLILARNFNTTTVTPDSFLLGDADMNGTVGLSDFLTFRRAFQYTETVAATNTIAVPEPQAIRTSVLGWLMLISFRRWTKRKRRKRSAERCKFGETQ